MIDIWFGWDEAKNRSNLRKHGVTFEIAREVFRGPLRVSLIVSLIDRNVSGEERWQTFGVVGGSLLPMVTHTAWDEIEGDSLVEFVRIISARKATPAERESYEQGC